MIKRNWPAVAAVLAVLALVPAPALAAARTHHATRGLDYLHSQQITSTGGYSSPTATVWAILGAVATGERMGSDAWTHGGKNPVRSLQALNQETSATASGNAPLFYAQVIMAYLAAGHEGYVYDAGATHIDLLAHLQSYQDTTSATGNGSSYGSFSPSSSNRNYQAVRTTCWAILAQHALGIDNPDWAAAVAWLKAQKSFGLDAGQASDTVDTALAIQALRAGGVSAGTAPIPDAIGFLDGVQLSNGGFPDQQFSSAVKSATATAYAIQAIYAAGQRPSDGTWQASGGGPMDALNTMQIKRGAFAERDHTVINPVNVTGAALVALSRLNFASYPRSRPPAVKAFVYKPAFSTLQPKDNSTFKTTHIVLIRALYGDGAGGTGINAKAVRLSVDNVDKTKAAAAGSHGLHLELKNVANGKHTYVITLRDFAGNTRTATRSFIVDVPLPVSPTPTPTTTPPLPLRTYTNPTPKATTTPSVLSPTPTPSTTLYPTTSSSPYPSVTPSASSSPISGVPITGSSPGAGGGATPGKGGGSTAGFLGGTLLAMLPLGAALSYYLLHRRQEATAGSVAGQKLSGGGSGWQKLKDAFAKSKDLVKPARS